MTWIVGDGQQLELEVCGRVRGCGGARGRGRRAGRAASLRTGGAREPRVRVLLPPVGRRTPAAIMPAPRSRSARAARPPQPRRAASTRPARSS